jgi:hypothetical protein
MNVSKELSHYGINSRSKSVRWFGQKALADSIEYLDLIEPAYSQEDGEVLPDGVAENQDRPLLFFIQESRLSQVPDERSRQISCMSRTLACRGDRAYLAVIRPGMLDVMPVSLKERTPEWKTYRAGTDEALTFFSRLALGRCDELPSGPDVDFLFKEMFQLVDRTATRLDQLKLKRADVLSLVGRALFFRFLSDRGIIGENDLGKIAPQADGLTHCFDNAVDAAATSRWLDKTFNGDFLPLTDEGSLSFFESIGQRTGHRVFFHLGGIVRGEKPSGDDGFQMTLPIHWGHLDFAHIPVGLLSQVYEKLSWKWDERNARSTSIHYTPRNIAATLVGEAFDHLPDASDARVLDPACGAGVFLVIAFRRLYRELWKKTKQRPNTQAIRRILEQQLTGFDISDSALKLSALSLYLTAIELDPDPIPPEKLKFKALRKGKDAMLFDWRKEDDKPEGPVIGSMGPHVGNGFDGAFDLILCNPPWTSIEKKYKAIADELNIVSRNIVADLDADLARHYQNPDSSPDLPFLWRSLRWCKSGGRIAMALPARTLFKQGEIASEARKTLFQLIEVTGIINGSNLRKSKVWPDMDQPFMLLFARNRRPKAGHRLHFISPHTDHYLNSYGEMRIDSKSAQLVDIDETIEEPWLWKALAVGTALDVDVVRKVKSTGSAPLEKYWKRDLNLSCSNGYKIEPIEAQKDARALKSLKDIHANEAFHFVVKTSELNLFSRDKLCRSRIDKKASDPLRVYRGPLVLIKESPGPDRTEGWALFCSDDVAYSQSFYGYSGAGHAEGELLVKYLQIFVHSQLWLHYALLTSAKLGFERPNLYKMDLDECPFFPLGRLTEAQKKQVKQLSDRLLSNDSTVFKSIDTFFGKLYGLNYLDIEVIADTVQVREPNDELGIRASQVPTNAECLLFFRRVESVLTPFFKVLKKQPEVTFWKTSEDIESPFLVFVLSAKGRKHEDPKELFQSDVLPLANETGATCILKEVEGGLLVGLLRQYRYWTPSRARMLCAEIIRQHMDVFED